LAEMWAVGVRNGAEDGGSVKVGNAANFF
jgi:hypothetical protein